MIAGLDPDLGVSPADDELHAPTSADPHWLETVWFPFWIPDERISVYTRLWFRPNAGEQGGALQAWRGDGERLAHDAWSEAFAGRLDLRDLRLANGFRLRCLASLASYRIEYASPALELDLRFDARMEPNPVAPEEAPGMFAGHLEQPGRVSGSARIGARRYAIDCGSVRDRSWGPRVARADLRIGNAHGTSRSGDAFFAYVNPDALGRELITGGYLLRDGVAAQVVSGERHTRWEGNHPSALGLELRDALGRSADLLGRCANRQALDAGNGVYAVLNLVEWSPASTAQAADGIWGENHDIWSRSAWLAAGRAPLPAP